MASKFLRGRLRNRPKLRVSSRITLPTLLIGSVLVGIAFGLVIDTRAVGRGSPSGSVQAQSTDSGLESLGIPMPGMSSPSTTMWRAGNLLYGEARAPDKKTATFFVYDLTSQEVIFRDDAHTDIHDRQRNIMVDSEGNAYFAVNWDGIAKFDVEKKNVTVLSHKLPNFLRASTPEFSNGWIYGATGHSAPNDLFRFNPKEDKLEVLGPSWGYTAHLVMDPNERYFYYIPGAHGGGWEVGTPLLQYDVVTRKHKVIAFLKDVIENKYGYRLTGTFGLDIDKEGKRIAINFNAEKDPKGKDFGDPAVVIVHIPDSERCTDVVCSSTPRFQFRDVAPNLGINGDSDGPLFNAYLHSASWGDVNNDGWVDLVVGTFVKGSTQVKNKLLLNINGTFQDSGQSSIDIAGRAAGSVLADLDNDGDLDLYISNNTIAGSGDPEGQEPSRLLRNDNGVFVDVTQGSGIQAQSSNGRQVGVLDYNGDGLLDLFVVADNLRGTGPTVLLRNDGDFKFTNVTASAGLPSDIHGLGLAIGDVTGNGWPDIFVGGGTDIAKQTNYMFIAKGDGNYRLLDDDIFDWTPFSNGNEDWVAGASMADLNRDGRLDLLVGHHFGTSAEKANGARLRVYMNRKTKRNGDPEFEDITVAAGLPMIKSKAPHVELQDFDNDGWFDIYTSIKVDTPEGEAPLIFQHNGNPGDPTFSLAPNIPAIKNPHYYAGGPTADFNNDGKMDIFLAEWRSVSGTPTPSKLMQNTGAPGNWLQIKVDGNPAKRENAMGVGAKVKLYKAGTTQLIGFREISPAFGWSSSQPPIAHFGLGSETFVDVVVEMPFGGVTYTKKSVPANRLVVMPNGQVETPTHLGLEAIAVTESDPGFLIDPRPTGVGPYTVASAVPTVDFVPYPLPDYPGKPWSQWGAALFASNGKVYTAIGDHLKTEGNNSYLFEYDPITKKLKNVGDVIDAIGQGTAGQHHGKVHGQLNEGNDGYLYFGTYWGSSKAAAADPGYEGAVILRYPINTVAVIDGTSSRSSGSRLANIFDKTIDALRPGGTSSKTDNTLQPGGTSDTQFSIDNLTQGQNPEGGDPAPGSTSARPPRSGGSCNIGTGAPVALDAGWLILALVVPGLALTRWTRSGIRRRRVPGALLTPEGLPIPERKRE